MIAGTPSAALIDQIRSWLSPVILLGILGVISRHYSIVRKANTADLALALAADAEALKNYAAEVTSLRSELRATREGHRKEIASINEEHRKDMAEMSRRNTECDKDRDELREKVDALRDLVAGFNRVIVTASKDAIVALGDYPSEEVQHAARRVDELFARKD